MGYHRIDREQDEPTVRHQTVSRDQRDVGAGGHRAVRDQLHFNHTGAFGDWTRLLRDAFAMKSMRCRRLRAGTLGSVKWSRRAAAP